MATYWVKRSTGASADGPYTGPQLKSLAASGAVGPEALVSADNAKWIPAARVKGLFPEPTDTPEPVPPASTSDEDAPPAPDAQDDGVVDWAGPSPGLVASEPPPVPLTYATSTGGRLRNMQWFMICSIVLLSLGLINIGLTLYEDIPRLRTPAAPTTVVRTRTSGGRTIITTRKPAGGANATVLMAKVGVAVLSLCGTLGLFIYFTVWAYQVHREFQLFTNGAYPVSPGRACGFCYIPFYNLYWIAAMPYQLSQAVDWHLGSTRRETNPSTVLTFQIIGLIAGVCITGVNLLFFSLSILNVQKGLNALWNRSPDPSRAPAAWHQPGAGR